MSAASPRKTSSSSPVSSCRHSGCFQLPTFDLVELVGETCLFQGESREQWEQNGQRLLRAGMGLCWLYCSIPDWLSLPMYCSKPHCRQLFLFFFLFYFFCVCVCKFVLKCICSQVKTLSAKFHTENIFAAKLYTPPSRGMQCSNGESLKHNGTS